ncbi:MAG: U32 family peptidase [Lachnospiraceae bacterium]|nr:U32 family peptidase [Lachnospiraceae bacterium]
MIEKKVELLAPAGNYRALVGAINAGADAIYLGGDKFSARAYADNFTEEELLKALRYTHICGKKLYLTLNTLVKEKEFSLIYDYLKPLYEAGLDGIIVQDLGVWEYVRETFPGLALHASTQMTITGVMGAALLKSVGVSRIVPSRELSLEEIKTIKRKTGLEIECFIHGAMCYCYSGQCLFSSILGGRSGNRGRCAQPCRLPYKVSETGDILSTEEMYPLSLKDMCTIDYIPKLIEVGIDSFKIEGRMKKPEYAAGVTAIYRKYIDKYYENVSSYQVDEADMDRLYKLYIRSEVQSGYYERYNGREMITLGKGGYLGSDENLLKEISEDYLNEEKKIPVKIRGNFKVGERAALTIEGMGITQTSYGEPVQQALKRPMTKDDILKQLIKTGNSYVKIIDEDIDIEKNTVGENIIVGDNVFIPVAQLNELRRKAITAFEDKLIEANGFNKITPETKSDKTQQNLQNYQNLEENTLKKHSKPIKLHVFVQSLEQLQTVFQYPCDRVYIDSDLYLRDFDQISQYLEAYPNFAIYLSLPFIIRDKDIVYLDKLKKLLNSRINGFLVRNLEALSWVLSNDNKKYDIITDCGIYCFNAYAAGFLQKYADELTFPWELNNRELRKLTDMLTVTGDIKLSLPVYGTIPMMLTANCVKKTTGTCTHSELSHRMYLTDRYNTVFPVLCNCKHCYNIIYNSVPYSLHNEWQNLQKLGLFAVRLDFIFENDKQICEILDYYTGKSDNFPIAEYTSGHYKRGVE